MKALKFFKELTDEFDSFIKKAEEKISSVFSNNQNSYTQQNITPPMPQVPTMYQNASNKFVIDFLKFGDERLQNVSLIFDESDDTHIFINGEQEWFDTYYIKELGWSSDMKYRKVATPDMVFWIRPIDYQRFMYAINSSQRRYLAYKENKKNEELRRIEKSKPLINQETKEIRFTKPDGETYILDSNETEFYYAVCDAVSSLGGNNVVDIEYKSGNIINYKINGYQFGRIKLRPKKTKMQIITSNSVQWIEDIDLEQAKKLIPIWIDYCKTIL